jgi:hypothetical protein
MLLKRDEILDLFSYDPRGLLISKTTRGLWKAGKPVGQKGRKGYWLIRYLEKCHLIHRLIWCLFNGDIPEGMVIDHMNGNHQDNRIENLRMTTRSGNQRNMKMSRRNKSGTMGVYWDKHFNRWHVGIGMNGKRKHIGYFTEKDAAVAARKQAEKLYRFHPNHGRKVQLGVVDIEQGGSDGHPVH